MIDIESVGMTRMANDIPIVQADGLTKIFDHATPIRALDAVSFVVTGGDFMVIFGPSGSGKSTLLNVIGTLDQPTEGLVIVDGIDLSTLRGDRLADFRREKIGFVFQLFNLVPTLTALENVVMPLIPYRKELTFNLEARARELLEAIELGDRLRHLPGQLSGGEQQRVAIARALINHPKLILADEPTGNVDTETGEDIVQLLRRLNRERGITVLMVTHDATIASRADSVLHLQDGRILEDPTQLTV